MPMICATGAPHGRRGHGCGPPRRARVRAAAFGAHPCGSAGPSQRGREAGAGMLNGRARRVMKRSVMRCRWRARGFRKARPRRRRAAGLGDVGGDDALLARLLEVDGQLVALDGGDHAIAELLVEDAVAGLESADRLGVDDQVARLARLADALHARGARSCGASRASCRSRPRRRVPPARCRAGSRPRRRSCRHRGPAGSAPRHARAAARR